MLGSTKTKGIIVELGGDATGLSKAISSVTKEARDTQSELKKINKLLKLDPNNVTLLKQKQDLLNQSIEKTEDVVKSFKQAKDKADRDMANGTEVNEKAYRELERQIAANEYALKDVRKQADAVAKEIQDIQDGNLHDVADAADKAKDALKDAKTEAASFGDVLKADLIADGVSGLIDSAKGAIEDTKDYRKIMGSLEVSSQGAGYSAGQTEEAYKRLYGVLGDDQSSATALANLQALELEQDQLLDLIQNSIGGWAKYGDSIPIDSLAESINETAKAGQVTGTFADILNWGAKEGETYGVAMREATEENQAWNDAVADCKTAEDFFNLALSECATEADRVNLIMQAMADQGLASAADQWQKNNASLVEANEANADLQEQMALLGEQLEPLTTKLTGLITAALEWFNSLDSGTQNSIIALVSLVAAIGPVVTAFSGVTSSIGGVVKALPGMQSMFSSVMGFITAHPIAAMLAAVVALAVLIFTKGDEIKAVLQDVDNFLQGVFATDWTTVFGPVLGGALNGFLDAVEVVWNSVYDILNGVIDFVQGVFTGDWEQAWSGVKQILSGICDGMIGIVETAMDWISSLVSGAIGWICDLLGLAGSVTGTSVPTPSVPSKISSPPPMLASGGTVWSGSAIVGDGGPELLTVTGGHAVVQPLTSNTTNHNATHLGGVSISVYGAPGQDVRELAELVIDEMQAIVEETEAGLQ